MMKDVKTTKIRIQGMGEKLEPCPFCGKGFDFYQEHHKNKDGRLVTWQYFSHKKGSPKEGKCLLDELMEPLSIGAGDADVESGYIGESATKWNVQIRAQKQKAPLSMIQEDKQFEAAVTEILGRTGWTLTEKGTGTNYDTYEISLNLVRIRIEAALTEEQASELGYFGICALYIQGYGREEILSGDIERMTAAMDTAERNLLSAGIPFRPDYRFTRTLVWGSGRKYEINEELRTRYHLEEAEKRINEHQDEIEY
jgi:hypothetical protein